MIPLRPPASCFTCYNSRSVDRDGDIVTWCTIFDEVIVSEINAAEDCLTYEPCVDGDQPVDGQGERL